MIEFPPVGSFAWEMDMLSIRMGELRIAILEAIEDSWPGPFVRWLTWWPV